MIKTLQDLLNSREYDAYRFGSSSDDWLRDADRMARCDEAAKYGSDGSTHGELIQDWRDCLRDCFDLDDDVINSINAEIDLCEQWHEEHGSLDQEIG